MRHPVRLAIFVGLLTPSAACAVEDPQEGAGELPVDSGYVVTDDSIRLFYKTVGGGASDVVIPVGLYLEQAMLPLASADRRLVFYDPRARGRSDAGDRSLVTLDRQVADLEALRHGLAIDSMVLIGWSGLGMEMAVYAMRHPDRVTRLVQLAPVAARDDPYNAQAYRTRMERTDTIALAAVQRRRLSGDLADDPVGYCRALQAITAPAASANGETLAGFPDACHYPNEYLDSLSLLFQSLLTSFAGYDWRDSVARLTLPRLVIHGRHDAFPIEGSREWVPKGSNARLLVIDSAGHFPHLERPDVLFPAIEVFLRGDWPREALP